jgi:hypothetical protein
MNGRIRGIDNLETLREQNNNPIFISADASKWRRLKLHKESALLSIDWKSKAEK